jgi:PPOX class probable F420-dependent enzyme
MHDPQMLREPELRFLAEARRAVLVTIDPAGLPRPVPICHVVLDDLLFTPLDEKPKASADPLSLARVRDVEARPDVVVLADRWSEEWTRLAWLRVYGEATVVAQGTPGHTEAVVALREKYPQYEDHRLEERPLIRVEIRRSRSWGDVG